MSLSLPLVSICIPTYNAEQFITETINSALAQTYTALEIIISDDGSTDNTLDIIKALQLSLPEVRLPFRIIAHDRLGIAENWNYCISQATGKYIKFLFQDDLLQPECVEKMVALAEQDADIGLVFSRRAILFSDDTTFDAMYVDITEQWTKLEAIQSGQVLLADPKLLSPPLNKIGEPSNVLLKTEALHKVGLFDPKLSQVIDLDMWLRIMSCYKIGYIDESLASFRVHRQQQSQQNIQSGNAWLDDWRLHFKILSDASYEFLPTSLKTELPQLCLERIGGTYKELEGLRSQVVTAYADAQTAYEQVQKVQNQMQGVYAELEQFQTKYWQINEQLNLANAHLNHSNEQLNLTTEKLNSTSKQLDLATAHLSHSNEQLNLTTEKLNSTSKQLDLATAHLNHSNEQLNLTTEQLNLTTTHLHQSQETIAAMESSKFWQMRNAWFSLKQKVFKK